MFEHINSLISENEKPILDLLSCFYADEPDNKALRDAANNSEVFKLEKKYVPILNNNQSQEIGCDTLISSVGLRPAPVILTVLCLKPKRLFLLHTETSLSTAEKVRDDPDIIKLGLRPNIETVLKPFSETDAPANYDLLNREVLPRAKGRIVIDPTGGMKIMGISLAAMSFWRRLPMIYLKGEEKAGTVIPFSEELTYVKNPYDHFGDRDIALIKALFNKGNYVGAREVCESLIDSTGDPAAVTRFDLLSKVISLYRDWDAFQHSTEKNDETRQLSKKLQSIIDDQKRLGIQIISEEIAKQNIKFLIEIEKNWKSDPRQTDPYRIVDVFSNAERRARAGQYDDAVARLYRCLEMCSTWMLVKNWQIKKTDEPDITKIANAVDGQDNLQKQYKEKYNRDFPTQRWGVDDQMKILALVEPNNPAVRGYFSISGDSEETNLIKKRNRSILAHGTIPVEESDYEKFREKADLIVRHSLEVKCFNDLHSMCKFPDLLI
jgi:CRISPR-associated protein (TIGR02710 family)